MIITPLMVYTFFANLTYGIVDFIALEIILVSIFYFDEKNNIKLTYQVITKRLSQYKSTSYCIYIMITLIILYFGMSNYIQNIVIERFITLEWKIIPLLIMLSAFSIFWMAKINFRRSWSLPIVYKSFSIFVIFLFILLAIRYIPNILTMI